MANSPDSQNRVALTDKGIADLGRGLPLPGWATDFSDWKAKRVLDVGAGGGAVVRELISQGVHAVGIDTTDETFKASGVENDGHFVVADAAKLPFSPDDFDAALSAWSVFYYVDRGEEGQTRTYLAELCRVVKSGGELRLFGVDPKAYDVMLRYPQLRMRRSAPEDRGSYPVVSLAVNK